MKYEEIEEKLRVSPTLKMLRSRSAALMISFFDSQFKAKNEIAVANDVLIDELAFMIEQLHFCDDDDAASADLDSLSKAKRYLLRWTEECYLRNYVDEQTGKVFSILSTHTERAFRMLEVLRERDFVGTESKFSDIFAKLEDVVSNTTADPEARVAELERQKAALDEEIALIRRNGSVKTYEDYQIKSRMDDVVRLTNELMGDFKEVEDNFRTITKEIYERQAQRTFTKGTLLGYAFDSVDRLKESDQGKSFYSFWAFLMNESQQANLRNLIEQSISVMEERGLPANDRFLRRIKTLLHAAGQKVLEQNDQLGEKLSRVIAEKDSTENKKSRRTIQEIRLMALALTDKELPADCGITLDEDPMVWLPLERKLSEGQIVNDYDFVPQMASPVADEATLTRLYNPNLIDRKRLARNIGTLLDERREISLREVIEHFPLEKGLSELVAYITMSDNARKVSVNERVVEEIEFDEKEHRYLEAPQIIYHK